MPDWFCPFCGKYISPKDKTAVYWVDEDGRQYAHKECYEKVDKDNSLAEIKKGVGK